MTEKEIDQFHKDADTQGCGSGCLAIAVWLLFLVWTVWICIWIAHFLN